MGCGESLGVECLKGGGIEVQAQGSEGVLVEG